jgi:hypothetical protein
MDDEGTLRAIRSGTSKQETNKEETLDIFFHPLPKEWQVISLLLGL